MRNPQRVLSKSQIRDHVWKYGDKGAFTAVNMSMSYLRKKLDAGRAPMLRTVRGARHMVKAAE